MGHGYEHLLHHLDEHQQPIPEWLLKETDSMKIEVNEDTVEYTEALEGAKIEDFDTMPAQTVSLPGCYMPEHVVSKYGVEFMNKLNSGLLDPSQLKSLVKQCGAITEDLPSPSSLARFIHQSLVAPVKPQQRPEGFMAPSTARAMGIEIQPRKKTRKMKLLIEFDTHGEEITDAQIAEFVAGTMDLHSDEKGPDGNFSNIQAEIVSIKRHCETTRDRQAKLADLLMRRVEGGNDVVQAETLRKLLADMS